MKPTLTITRPAQKPQLGRAKVKKIHAIGTRSDNSTYRECRRWMLPDPADLSPEEFAKIPEERWCLKCAFDLNLYTPPPRKATEWSRPCTEEELRVTYRTLLPVLGPSDWADQMCGASELEVDVPRKLRWILADHFAHVLEDLTKADVPFTLRKCPMPHARYLDVRLPRDLDHRMIRKGAEAWLKAMANVEDQPRSTQPGHPNQP